MDTGPAKQIAATGYFQNYHVCISVLSPTNFIIIFGSHSSLAKMVGYLKGIELNFMKGDRGLNARTAPMYIKLLIISSLTLLHVMFLFFQNKSIGILYPE